MTLLIILTVLLLLLFSGLPVAFALAGMGTAMLLFKGIPFAMVVQNLHGGVDDFILLSVPLFLLMSNILLKAGTGRELFDAVQSWVGHWPGGLGVAAIISCGIFSAISGSSVATAATVGAVALPEMMRLGYPQRFTLGLLAAGGTLGILIPPSIPLIIYGVIAEESVGTLFLAGIGPGLLLLVVFSAFASIYAMVQSRRSKMPKVARASWSERWAATRRAYPTVAIALLMIVGIYSGAFTPTEAAAVGVAASLLVTMVLQRRLALAGLVEAIQSTVSTTVVLFLVVIGAKLFSRAVTIYQIPAQVTGLIDANSGDQGTFLLFLAGILLVIGLFLEAIAMLLIMMPILLPSILALHIDPIWFAIYFVILIEIALLTPPVGLNLFVIQTVAKTRLGTVAQGVIPFLILMLASLYLIYLVPEIALYIPFNT